MSPHNSKGNPFYAPYEHQDLVAKHADGTGGLPFPFPTLVYLPDEDRYEEAQKLQEGANGVSISGAQVREVYLANGRPLPKWFTRTEMAKILKESHPPYHKQGISI